MRRFIFALMLLLLAASTYATYRETLSVYGILKTADGNYLNGTYSIDFNIFTGNGAQVYDENHNGSQAPRVTVTNGYFSVSLGDTNVLPVNLFTADHNLAMNVNSAGWLSPTLALRATPNAVTATRALDFNVARDLNVVGNITVGGNINGDTVTAGGLTVYSGGISSGAGIVSTGGNITVSNGSFTAPNPTYDSSIAGSLSLTTATKDLNVAGRINTGDLNANNYYLNGSSLETVYYTQTDANGVFRKLTDAVDVNETTIGPSDINTAKLVVGGNTIEEGLASL